MLKYAKTHLYLPQECIPVGCVPPRSRSICLGGVRATHAPNHAHPPQPCMPPSAIQAPSHARPQPCTPLATHVPPWPCTPPPAMHATPCGQNHRRLWKYNLAPTSLRTVIIHIYCQNSPKLVDLLNTTIKLGPAYNEFSYNEHLAIMSRFLRIKNIDIHVKVFGYLFTARRRSCGKIMFSVVCVCQSFSSHRGIPVQPPPACPPYRTLSSFRHIETS